MKVLLINQSDIQGGAAIAGFRLLQGLKEKGVDVRLFVDNKRTQCEFVSALENRRSFTEKILNRATSLIGLNYIHILSSFSIPKTDAYHNIHILNFHNLHGGYFNYLAMPSLTKNKPAIFTLHDMWSFTGHCAYSYDCEKWISGCGNCPYPDSYPSIRRDITRIEWKLKKWAYSRSNLTIVAPSRWLAEQARKSMLNRFPIYHIPNGFDTEAYRPHDRALCRSVLGIPFDAKVLMFAAQNLRDPRKGGHLLLKALKDIPQALKARALLISLGDGGESIAGDTGLKTLQLGYVGGDHLKSICYSAADVFVFPTRADNLPIVLQESMACGTPMVSFNIGGVPDLIRPGTTGFLAKPEDAEELRDNIVRLLEDDDLRQRMSEACRSIAVEEYGLELQATRYIALFNDILGN